MKKQSIEKPALLIIDMVKDNLNPEHPYPITEAALGIVPAINNTIKLFRSQDWPVIFSTDAFHEKDFIFGGRMKPHSLAGTPGAEVADQLDYQPETDTWLPKPRFSAFFKTGLDTILYNKEVTLCALAGISTNYCVLSTLMDAICYDFKVILLEDCTAAGSEGMHAGTLSLYRRNPLDPLLRIASSADLAEMLAIP